jgi:hypothetical protein
MIFTRMSKLRKLRWRTQEDEAAKDCAPVQIVCGAGDPTETKELPALSFQDGFQPAKSFDRSLSGRPDLNSP